MIVRVTPRGMLNVFFRHRVKFMLVFLLFFGAAAAYCAIATPKFRSDAALLVKFASNNTARGDGLPSLGIAAQQIERKEVVNSQIGLLQSQDLLSSVLDAITIAAIYPSLSSVPDSRMQRQMALQQFARDLDVEPQKDSSIIQLSLLNRDAEVSAKALTLLIDKFIGLQSTIYQSAELPFMQEQLAQAREQLQKSRAAVQAFKSSTGISSLDEERTLLLRQQADMQESLTQAISKQEEAEGRYRKLEAMLKEMPDQIKLSDENDRFKAVDDARQHLSDLLARQKQLGTNYKPDSSTMQALTTQITFARQQLAAVSKESAARIRTGANPVRQQAEIDLAAAAGDQYGATASRESYDAELSRIQQRLRLLEAQSEQLNSLELQQQVDEENFRNYLQAANDARVTDSLNRQRISSIAVVQSPTAPMKPAQPRLPVILAAGLLLGLAGAVTATMLSEMADESFSTSDQIETIMGLPVLGTFTMRAPMGARPLPAYVKLLPLLILLLAATVPGLAFGFDKLDPVYGQRLVVRSPSGDVVEFLYPQHGQFQREKPNGGTLGWAKRVGSTLTFYDRNGRRESVARPGLLPPNYPIAAIAVIRDTSGNPIGMIADY